MAHAQKPDFDFRRNRRVHLIRRGRQFSRLLAAEVCASAVVMLDTPCSEVVWRVVANHSIRQFPLHFLSRALPCVITFQLDSTTKRFLSISRTFSHITYKRTPTTVHVFEEVVTLHGRSVVSRAVATPWRHQLCTQLSSYLFLNTFTVGKTHHSTIKDFYGIVTIHNSC
jgi:hypothetical protein